MAVPTIKLLFVFLYDVIGSSAFHNYDGYTVSSYGSICYRNDSSTVAYKMEPSFLSFSIKITVEMVIFLKLLDENVAHITGASLGHENNDLKSI